MVATRQERYERRIERQGLVKVCVRVPEESREAILKLADKLRRLARKGKLENCT